MKLFEQIEQICRERGIDRDVLIETIEAAMKAAAKKVFGEQREIEADFNEETGGVDLRFILIVSDEDEVESPQREITLEQARKYADPATNCCSPSSIVKRISSKRVSKTAVSASSSNSKPRNTPLVASRRRRQSRSSTNACVKPNARTFTRSSKTRRTN